MSDQSESRIIKALESDFGKMLKIVIFTFSMAAAWFSLYYKVDNIQNNHLVHLQAKIDEACAVNKEQDKSIQSIDLKIERILTILNK